MSLLRDMLDKALKERDTAIRERDNWRAIAEASGADYRDACAEIEFLRGEVAALKKLREMDMQVIIDLGKKTKQGTTKE
jgi:hypothetical protein